jgi:hypothetical protein
MTEKSVFNFILELFHHVNYKDREDLFDLEAHYIAEAMAYRILYFRPDLKANALIHLGYHLDGDEEEVSMDIIAIHCRGIKRILINDSFRRFELREKIIELSMKLSVIKTLLYLSAVDNQKTFDKNWEDEDLIQAYLRKKIDSFDYHTYKTYREFIDNLNIRSFDLHESEIENLRPDVDDNILDRFDAWLDSGEAFDIPEEEAVVESSEQDSFDFEVAEDESEVRKNRPKEDIIEDFELYIDNLKKTIKKVARSEVVRNFPILVRRDNMTFFNSFSFFEVHDGDYKVFLDMLNDLEVDGIKINYEVIDYDNIKLTWDKEEYRKYFNSLEFKIEK